MEIANRRLQRDTLNGSVAARFQSAQQFRRAATPVDASDATTFIAFNQQADIHRDGHVRKVQDKIGGSKHAEAPLVVDEMDPDALQRVFSR